MHFSFVGLALAMMVTSTMAKPRGPYLISVTGKTNSSINGYVKACNAGVAQEGLCYDSSQVPEDSSFYQFYHEAGLDAKSRRASYLVFNLLVKAESGLQSLPSAVRLEPTLGSNVNVAFIPVGVNKPTPFSVAANGSVYATGLADDRSWNETRPEPDGADRQAANFQVCWQWVGAYWYHAIGWATSLPPQNPSCEPVDLKLVDLVPPSSTRAMDRTPTDLPGSENDKVGR
ncbi:hypothetical protein GGS24DRAFT_273794 [Hypoxylon argillaceum]|nr:hypothetical protein GGS24DRAFT_273794 [Hypoxylon argillaceum]KAI1146581.1 hypothetical protein F4825DRAFT_188829 [Nemania diffusa]